MSRFGSRESCSAGALNAFGVNPSRDGAVGPGWSSLTSGLDDSPGQRRTIIATGLISACLFVVVGLAFDLQLYADGSIFAYSVALQDSWAVHWHNISGRVTVYLASCWPAEMLVALTGSARAGIALYGLLFFSAQLLGLAITYAADHSPGRRVFTTACLSTACLCPLVFGFPTEMWYAHALFWPTLALAHYAPLGVGGWLLTSTAFVALVHTHGGGAIFAAVVAISAALRCQKGILSRALVALGLAMAVWAAMQSAFRPDAQISPVLMTAAFNFIDPANFLKPVVAELLVAVLGPVLLSSAFRRMGLAKPGPLALAVTLALFTLYWSSIDRSLLAEDRYFLRTAVFYLTPVFGLVALIGILQGEGMRFRELEPWLQADRWAWTTAWRPLAIGALGLVVLVHGVETVKFAKGWREYTYVVRRLSAPGTGPATADETASVLSSRIPARLNEFSWSSTTHYLSVVAAPDLNPARLIVSADEGYHWITCSLAKRHVGRLTVPRKARKLVETHACRPS